MLKRRKEEKKRKFYTIEQWIEDKRIIKEIKKDLGQLIKFINGDETLVSLTPIWRYSLNAKFLFKYYAHPKQQRINQSL